MEINFECKKCGSIFDCNVGKITLPENSLKPHFEKNIICPMCGQRSMDEILLTELGQTQLARAIFELEADDTFSPQNDELNDYGFYEGECQGCDIFQPLNDLGLCEECAGKLDRDFIRQRDWTYSSLSFAVPESEREELRKEVIKHYGKELELIAPLKGDQKKSKKNKSKRKKGFKHRNKST